MLFGLLFFIPFAGLAIGAGMGALFGHFGQKGIDKAFQQQVRDYLKPGTSALFMVIEQATPDKATAALQQYGGTVIKTSLSDEDTKRSKKPSPHPRRRRPPRFNYDKEANHGCSWSRHPSDPVRDLGRRRRPSRPGDRPSRVDLEFSGLDARTFALVKIAA